MQYKIYYDSSNTKDVIICFICFILFWGKVLDLWRQQMDETYTVKEFVKEIAVWQQEGFTDSNLWKSLEQYIQPDLLTGKTPSMGDNHD